MKLICLGFTERHDRCLESLLTELSDADILMLSHHPFEYFLYHAVVGNNIIIMTLVLSSHSISHGPGKVYGMFYVPFRQASSSHQCHRSGSPGYLESIHYCAFFKMSFRTFYELLTAICRRNNEVVSRYYRLGSPPDRCFFVICCGAIKLAD